MTLRERLRAILDERGPLTAQQLADIVDRASSQVRELLNDDARRGRIVKIPPQDGSYHGIRYRATDDAERKEIMAAKVKPEPPKEFRMPTEPRQLCDV